MGKDCSLPHAFTLIQPRSSEQVPTPPDLYRSLLDQTNDGVYVVDRDRRVSYWNEAASRLTGYSAAEMVGQPCEDHARCHADDTGQILCRSGCMIDACMQDGETREADLFLRHRKGYRIPIRVRVVPIRATDGSITGAAEIFTDNTRGLAIRRRSEDLHRLRFLDEVTELPNSRFLEMSLQTALNEFRIHEDPFGLLIFDVDNLRSINERLGRNTGDRLLREVAKAVTSAFRSTDIVGRWNGGELMVLLQHVDTKILSTLANRCCGMVSRAAIEGDGAPVRMSVSAGGTMANLFDTSETLRSRAERLMRRSKEESPGCSLVE